MSDTDVFPRSFENLVLNAKRSEVTSLIEAIREDVEESLDANGPFHVAMLAPAGHLGFRQIASLDPIWNATLLSLVIDVAPAVEAARTPINDDVVFSYRFNPDANDHKLFLDTSGWKAFLTRAGELASKYAYAVTTDISDFYTRLNHHRLDNALRQVAPGHQAPFEIMAILGNYTGSNSYGLPVGGNAARILAEATLIQVDHLLTVKGIKYCRFVDDMIFFCDSVDQAYTILTETSKVLSDTQGLLLQRSKTRILTSAELASSLKLALDEEIEGETPDIAVQRKRLSNLKLKYDPYSASPEEDYEALKKEISNIDLLLLLERELSKSTIHIHSARRIVSAMRFSSPKITQKTAETLVGQLKRLYPITYLVLDVVRSLLVDLDSDARAQIKVKLLAAMSEQRFVFVIDYHQIYLVRALAMCPGTDTLAALEGIYSRSTNPIVRREVILAMHKLKDWAWLSNLKTNFVGLTPPERRAFLVASFGLSDEGKHWRKRTRKSLSAFESLVLDWAQDEKNREAV